MAEQEQGTSTEQSTSTETTAEPTLEQVYKQFNVEETASTFEHQPQRQEPAPQQREVAAPLGAEIPDPVLDQAGFKSWLATQNTDLRKTLGTLQMTQRQIAVAEMRRQEESDIRSAVQKVKEKAGDLDDDFVEIALGQKARRDPKFMSIYQNRHRNPAAWNAALGAVSNEIKSKVQFRQDSQLTENVRAARQSTQTSLTTSDQPQSGSLEDKLKSAKTDAEFARIWDSARG